MFAKIEASQAFLENVTYQMNHMTCMFQFFRRPKKSASQLTRRPQTRSSRISSPAPLVSSRWFV